MRECGFQSHRQFLSLNIVLNLNLSKLANSNFFGKYPQTVILAKSVRKKVDKKLSEKRADLEQRGTHSQQQL